MACVEIIFSDRQETFSIVDKWKDLCAAAEMLLNFSIPERCAMAWQKGNHATACDDLENLLTNTLIHFFIGAGSHLESTPIVWGESLDDRRAMRADLARLKTSLVKAIRKEAASWQLLAAAELTNALCCDYRRLITSHGRRCSCLTGHDARWRHD